MTDSCANCGTQDVALKRCARCKQVSFCGTECQKVAWKNHKNACTPPLTLEDVSRKINLADMAGDWRGVLKWEGRMEELLEGKSDPDREYILQTFRNAYHHQLTQTGSPDAALGIARIEERRIDILEKMQLFPEVGEAMCNHAGKLLSAGRNEDAASSFQRAREFGALHGLFLVECRASTGLGEIANIDGRHAEALDLLRHARQVAPLNEQRNSNYELVVLQSLCAALFASLFSGEATEVETTQLLDEAETTVASFTEAAKHDSSNKRRLSFSELSCLYYTARLHEARGKPQDAAKTVRTLISQMQNNDASVRRMADPCQQVLAEANCQLKILHPTHGEQDLIKAVAAQLATLDSYL